jgi:hypothetical protein
MGSRPRLLIALTLTYRLSIVRRNSAGEAQQP